MAVSPEFSEKISELAQKYQARKKELGEKGLKELSEANVRKDFIDKLFSALGWATDDSHEYDAERYVRGAGFADIALKIKEKPVVFIEAKRFGLVPSKSERGVQTTLMGYKIFADWTAEERQVLNYAGMTVGVKWAVLTNFEKFRLFNAKTGETIIDISDPKEYLDRIEELALLSKHNVTNGNIDRLEKHVELPDIDLDFLNLLNDLRLRLSRNILKNCPDLSLDKIKYVVQRILDRLILIRFAEDRWILEDPDQLRSTYEIWQRTKTYQKLKLTGLLKGIFEGFDEIHDSKIFQSEQEVDKILDSVDSEVLGDIILLLYNQSFRKFTSDILGNTYENYLGHELFIDNGVLQLRPNQQLRKNEGIYYTPSYVVDYVIGKTIGPRLQRIWIETERLMRQEKYEEGKRRFEEIKSIKIVDPSCGSGSFLIKAFRTIIAYFEKYNELVNSINEDTTNEILELRNRGKNKEAWQLEGKKLSLYSNYEKEVLYNCIFGVDLDPQAAEIASVNLALQALKKGEKLPLILGQNIKTGNSLVSDKEWELGQYFSDRAKEIPFDWKTNFKEIFESGGFDIVIGNPPHGAALSKEERNFFGKTYPIAEGNRNTASLFVERSFQILKESGTFGLVLPKSLTFSEKWKTARSFLQQKMALIEIADISKAFPKVLLEQIVVMAEKRINSKETYIGTRLFRNEEPLSSEISFDLAKSVDAIPVRVTKEDLAIFQKIMKKSIRMGTISHTTRGLPLQKNSDEEKGDSKIPLFRGDDIKPYFIAKPHTFVKKKEIDYESDKVKGLLKPKIMSQRIVAHVMKPIDHIVVMSTLGGKETLSVDTVENTMLNNKSFEIKYVLANLNSRIASWLSYVFIFNKAVRTMDLDDYYISKLPIPPADKTTQTKIAKLVDKLLAASADYFSQRPEFEKYLNKLPLTFSSPFSQIYNEIPMKHKEVGISSLAKGALRKLCASVDGDELVIRVIYDNDEEEEKDDEIIRMQVLDSLYLQFLKESVNIAKFSKAYGNLLEKTLDIVVPNFETNANENMKKIHGLMTQFLADVGELQMKINMIRNTMDEIDNILFGLIGLNSNEVAHIVEQTGHGYYTE